MEHEVIWLAPWCDKCEREYQGDVGRTWCIDDIYDPCDLCERQSVKYVIASRTKREQTR